MSRATRKTPDRQLAEVRSAMQLLGATFAVAGALPLVIAVAEPGSAVRLVLPLLATLVLVGPGVWYVMASFLIRKGVAWAADYCLWVAVGQIAVVAILVVYGAATHEALLIVPALLALFFIPALIAMCWQLLRARQSIRDIATEGHGFTPVKIRPVLPMTSERTDD